MPVTPRHAIGDADGPLLERAAPQAALDDLCSRARAGSGGVTLVEGSAGIGKSALLDATAARSEAAGLQVLCARGGQFEHDLPWGVVRYLLAPALQGAGRASLFAGAAVHAASVLGHPAPAAPPPSDDPPAVALHGLHWLVANLAAERPLLLVIDDAHWADRPSLRWLAYLAARAADLPVALVVAVRPGEPGGDMIAGAAQGAAVLALEALSQQAAGRLARRTLGDGAEEAFVRACHTASAGNPFLLHELTAELARERVEPIAANAGQLEALRPAGLSRAVLLRLARLPAPAVRLAEAVAILGVHATLRDAAALAGLADDRAEQAADELAAADILAAGLPLRFVHPIVRGLVEDELPAVRRARWHARAAELLEHAGAGPDAVAIHLLAAEPRGDAHAVATLRGAGALAVARGAPDGAVTYLRRALVEPPPPGERGEVLVQLGEAEAQAGEPAAAGSLRQALSCAVGETARVRSALALARVLFLADRAGEGVRILDDTRVTLGEEHRELALHLEAAAVDAARQDFAVQAEMTPRIERLREQVAGDTHAERLLLVGMAMHSAQCGDSAHATVDLAERGLAGGQLLSEESTTSIAVHLGIHALVIADRPDLALGHLERLVQTARTHGSAPGVGIASMCRSHARLQHGVVGEAEADAWTSLDAARASGWASIVPWALRCLIDALLEQGRLAEAKAQLERNGLTGELPDRPFFEALASARGRLAIARGEPETGVRDLLTHGRRLAETGAPNPALSGWRSHAAPALEALGREDEARALVDEELELARAYGAPRAHAAALRASAALASRRRRPEQLELLREATEVIEASPSLLERAHCLVALGAALRRHNRRADARDPLLRGLEEGMRCGATVLAARARRELRTCGTRPRRPARSGPDALTAAELNVARLAAEGASNREIAQALFVSRRTVETHLTHTYRKLGIGARTGLAAALRR